MSRGSTSCQSGDPVGLLQDRFWVIFGSVWAHGSYMWGLGGTEIQNVEQVLVFKAFLKGPKERRPPHENKRQSEPQRWEGVGGGKPTPWRPVWRFVWGFGDLVTASTRLETEPRRICFCGLDGMLVDSVRVFVIVVGYA